MARMTLDYVTLYSEVSYFLGLTARGTAPTGTNLTTCQDLVHRGIRRFLYPINMETGQPHEWQFIKQFYTFPTATNQWKYALPVDFSELCDTIHFDSQELQPSLVKVSGDQILEMRSDVTTSEWPQYFALVPARYDAEIGTTYELWLYPTPDQKYILNYFYRVDPIKLSATTDFTIGGIRAAEAILETCLAVAEQQEDDTFGLHSQLSDTLIQKLIKFDTFLDSDTLGNLYYGQQREWPPHRPYLVAFKDSNIYADER